jgi:hypothetical protein
VTATAVAPAATVPAGVTVRNPADSAAAAHPTATATATTTPPDNCCTYSCCGCSLLCLSLEINLRSINQSIDGNNMRYKVEMVEH